MSQLGARYTLEQCKHGHKYTPENTRIRMQNGKAYQQCVECHERAMQRSKRARHKRAGTSPWDTTETCRKKRHKRTAENTSVSKDGTIHCKRCRAESVKKRAKRLTIIPCLARTCKRHTARVHVSEPVVYVCPLHKASPPALLVSVLRKLGRLDLLDAA
jgi:hypothetical protein